MYERVPRWVYFIREVGIVGPVKIGCSQLPEQRLKNLTVWAPRPLYIAARCDGGYDLEMRFHHRFERYHTHSEWFAPSPEMDWVIREVAAGTFDFASLPCRKSMVKPKPRSEWSLRRQSLILRVGHRMRKLKGRVPPEVHAAYDTVYRVDGEGRDHAVAILEQYLAQPLVSEAA